MRFRPGMLMVPVGRRGMGEETTGRHQGQRHVHPGHTDCDTGQGSLECRLCHRVSLSPDRSSTLILEACLPTDAHGCYTIFGSVLRSSGLTVSMIRLRYAGLAPAAVRDNEKQRRQAGKEN